LKKSYGPKLFRPGAVHGTDRIIPRNYSSTIILKINSAEFCSAELYSAELYSAELYSAELYSAELFSAELYSANFLQKYFFLQVFFGEKIKLWTEVVVGTLIHLVNGTPHVGRKSEKFVKNSIDMLMLQTLGGNIWEK